MVFDMLPERVRILYKVPIVPEVVVRATVQHAYAVCIDARIHVPVIACQLGYSLLENRAPQCFVRADLGKKQAVPVIERKLIVHIGSERDTQSVQVDSVDAGLASSSVVENFMDAFRILRESTEGDHDPAVADATLGDVVRRDTRWPPQGIGRVFGPKSLPVNLVGLGEPSYSFGPFVLIVSPVKGVIRRERGIGELPGSQLHSSECLRPFEPLPLLFCHSLLLLLLDPSTLDSLLLLFLLPSSFHFLVTLPFCLFYDFFPAFFFSSYF